MKPLGNAGECSKKSRLELGIRKPGSGKWPERIGKERVWVGGGENLHVCMRRGR